MPLPTHVEHQLAVYSPPLNTGLDIVYLEDDFLVVNKPSGLLSVPGRGERMADSMAARVQAEYPETLIVHRLDLPTSGLLMLARSPQMHRKLSDLFQRRQVHKRYTAVLAGLVAPDQGEVALPLITDWPNRPRQKVDHVEGKPALTRWTVLDRDANTQTTRVELMPVTGRSHQLRVHMMSIGHPILGDPMYASREQRDQAPRLLLHATELTLPHPNTGQPVRVISSAPF
ncbi:MAG: RluA family pseudouridine synthase [Burkholderiales bacterium]|nr:RluA family pseudouridine synthase [Burkholderiales bacterium]